MEHPVAVPATFSSAAPQAELALNVLFNGVRYYVAEIGSAPLGDAPSGGASLDVAGRASGVAGARSGPHGFEVVNKHTGHGAFLDGAVADKIRTSFHAFVAQHGGQVSADQVDDFISDYDALLMQRVVYH